MELDKNSEFTPYSPTCFFCQRFKQGSWPVGPQPACQAFKKIPLKIWDGSSHHLEPVSGDHGLTFELRSDIKKPPDWAPGPAAAAATAAKKETEQAPGRRRQAARRWGVRLKHHPGGADHNQKRHGWRYGSLGAARRSVRGTTDEGERSEYYSRATRHGVKITPEKYTPPPPKAKPAPKPEPEKPAPKGETEIPKVKPRGLENVESYKRDKEMSADAYERTRRVIERNAASLGISYEEAEAFVNAGIDDFRKVAYESTARRRVYLSAFEKVLEDGRFKSQFETGTSDGALDPDYRKRAENNGMGTPKDLNPSLRPIYGYLHGDQVGSGGVGGYGDIAVVFKKDIKRRTSVTYDDSLWPMAERNIYATPVSRPDRMGLGDQAIQKMFSSYTSGAKKPSRDWMKSTGYFELQFHGQATVKDFEKVILPSSYRRDPYAANVIKRLDELKIPYEFTESRSYGSNY